MSASVSAATQRSRTRKLPPATSPLVPVNVWFPTKCLLRYLRGLPVNYFVFHFFRTGGIPAKNSKGERLLVYIGIIDILQSYR